MKKRFISLFFAATYNICIFAQSVYMHEAQEDAMHSDGDGISSVLIFLWLAGAVLFLIIFVPLIIGEKVSDAKFSKKNDRRSNMLDTEAFTMLNLLALRNRDFAKIKESENWKKWFRKGYHDGVDNGEKEGFWDYKVRPQKYVVRNWEEYSEQYFAQRESQKIFVDIECAGDVRLAKLAYDEGRRNGIKRRNEKGDSREMLN